MGGLYRPFGAQRTFTMTAAAEQALGADSPGVAFIRSCVGEPLKRSVRLLSGKES